ncbi:2-hydroxyacid dehydrogenase [Oryzifoliimicrobium ureilyticus]|uniref:2-hydroxyacid dehydrogenase n=1 Tax=Oryzifoliimicrobium ureilyticus TaxID=3113724 RepID=UPI003076688D
MNIVLCGSFFPDVHYYLSKALPEGQDFKIVAWNGSDKEIPERADVMIPMMHKIDADLIDLARPRLIQQWGSGLEGVDLSHARRREVAVANVAAFGGNADSVAEHAVLLVLALLRKVNEAQLNVRGGQLGAPVGTPLFSQTVCLYGLGAIALPLSRLLKAFGVRLVGVTRDPNAPKVQNYNVDACYSTEEILTCLAETDILIPCLRQSDNNAGLIGEPELRAMPQGGLLVNVARGGLVQYDALFSALQDGHLAGAGLDVFWREPFDPRDPLLSLPNVIATPHIAGITRNSMRDIAQGVAENLMRLHRGEPLINRVV